MLVVLAFVNQLGFEGFKGGGGGGAGLDGIYKK